MVMYPEIMLRAQQEIDAVVGRDRLPTFEDSADLPYIAAVIREVLRWRPVAPLGMCLYSDAILLRSPTPFVAIPKRCSQVHATFSAEKL